MDGLMIQMQEFLSTAALGLVVGLVFHTYHLVVKKAGVGKILLYLADLLIWIVLIMLVFLALLIINHGEMRAYVLIALALGGIIYRFFLVPVLDKPLSWLADVLVSGCRRLFGMLFRPVIMAGRNILARFRPPPGDDGEEGPDEDKKG